MIAIAVGILLFIGGFIIRETGGPASGGGIGGHSRSSTRTGKQVTDADYTGKPILVFFGYTHCPDVCPTTLSDMSQMLDKLGPDKKATALFITVDPARDTPAVLKDYLSSFDPRIVGLTGDQAAIDDVAHKYRVYARRRTARTATTRWITRPSSI